MDFGAHLPLMDFGGHPYTLDHLVAYTKTAARARLQCAVGERPPGVLGAVARRADRARRGDGALGRHDAGDDGRARGGARPGAARQDAWARSTACPAVGCVVARRSGLVAPTTTRPSGSTSPSAGRGSTRRSARSARCGATTASRSSAASTRPRASRWSPGRHNRGGPPIWVGSWGSDAGLRRVARLADGWLASAYNTTPELFGDAWHAPPGAARGPREGPRHVPERAGDDVVLHHRRPRRSRPRSSQERVIPTVHRPEEMLRERLPIGPPELFAEKLTAFATAGVQRVFIWPVADEATPARALLERGATARRPVARPGVRGVAASCNPSYLT